jgi:signal peptidase I
MPEPYTPVEPLSAAEALRVPEQLVATDPVSVPGDGRVATDAGSLRMERVVEELIAWLKTLASAAVYATLIVTFGFQVARVEGHSMAPTLSDQDRLIVNKLAYRIGEPHIGDIVMLYYPNDPNKSFVKRVIAEEGDQVRIVDGKVYRNDILLRAPGAASPTAFFGHSMGALVAFEVTRRFEAAGMPITALFDYQEKLRP